jgi:hypothetical protein
MKALQDNLQKMTKEIMDANQTKTEHNQEGMDVNLKEMRKEIKFGQAEMKTTENDIQEKMDASLTHRKYNRKKRASCKETMEETTAYHEATEVYTGKIKPDPRIIQSVEDPQEVPKEDAIVKPVKGRKKRHRVRKLIAGRGRDPKAMM